MERKEKLPEGPNTVFVYTFRMNSELKSLLDQAAVSETARVGRRVTINEVASEILAAHFNRPDLAKISRGSPGRPPGAHATPAPPAPEEMVPAGQ